MDNQTKKSIYSLLNLIDFLDTVDFIKIDMEKFNKIRESLFEITNKENSEITVSQQFINSQNLTKDRYELIKIIPIFFKSKKIFKKKIDILNFLSENLKISKAKNWKNKTIDDISGNIILIILSLKNEEYNEFVNTLNFYISSNELNLSSKTNSIKKSTKNNFMNMWFDFFENYRK